MRLCRTLLFSFAFAFALVPAALAGLVNGDAEEAGPGGVPAGWRFSAPSTGYSVISLAQGAYQGISCIRVTWAGEGDPATPGNVMQSVPAEEYRGKQVVFRAAVFVDGASEGLLWLRADGEGGKTLLQRDLGQRPATGAAWQHYEVVADVPREAVSLSVGCLVRGTGSVSLDDLSLRVSGDTPRPVKPTPPAPLTDRGLHNLSAFARTFGLVRHFHPSDEAELADWDRIAVGGAKAVEGAADADELAQMLREIFVPVAPSVDIFATGTPRPRPDLPPSTRSRAWRHLGFGHGQRSIFKSSRVDLEHGTATDDAYPDPDSPWVEDLAGGVTCRIPLAVPADEEGTLPRGSGEPGWMLPASLVPSGKDRASRLGAVVVAWNVLRHFNPEFESVHVDWPEALRSALRGAATDPTERRFLDTLRRLVARIDDGQARVTQASEPQGYVLPLSLRWVGGQLVVVAAARNAGLGPGDVIEFLDSRPVAELAREEAQLISAATPQWMSWRLAHELIRFDSPAPRVIRARSHARNDESVEVWIRPQDPSLELPAPPRPDAVAEVAPGIWYVDATRFDRYEFHDALPKLAEAEGLIFDFRGSTNGLDYEALFRHLGRGILTGPQHHVPIVRWPDGRRLEFYRSREWEITPMRPQLTARKLFLANGSSVGITETCLGVVEGHRLGQIVGEPTAGTSGDTNSVLLPGGYRMEWTATKVLKHDSSREHGRGIAPTVPVSPTRGGIAAGRDEVLERAVEALAG